MRRTRRAIQQIELDLGRYELRHDGRRVDLPRKAMDLLIFLVGRRDQLVSREEITGKLWRSDLFIDAESNINNLARKIRTALGDNAKKRRFLETVVGKGYRFIGPVRLIDARLPSLDFRSRSGPGSTPDRVRAWGERSTLAILPLLLLGGATDDQGLCLGFADALVSRLGNLEGMDVLPISAVLSVPQEATASEVASRLGVRFVLMGAMQMSKGVWRLSLEMFDAHLHAPCFARKCDLDRASLAELQDELARQIAGALNRPLGAPAARGRPRHTKDHLAYSEFMRGYRLSALGDPALLEKAAEHLNAAVTRDPSFSLAHAVLSFVYATRHFEIDPASMWLGKAEFHCERALELNADLPEGHVARAFLLWGPSKNFQHAEAIAELKRALVQQNNLPHAYNRLGTILAHIGLLDRALEMYERGRLFHPQRAISHSVVQVYVWNCDQELARQEINAWRSESPGNKYPTYFAAQQALAAANWPEAEVLLDEAGRTIADEPIIISLQGLLYALTGKVAEALDCMARACAIPKSFGHSHHTYYQIACILSVLGRSEAAFEWLERSVTTGFACWPFFLKDPCLRNLRTLTRFEDLVSSLQAKYPDSLGLL
jgi:DNA-binding winged helix-turn-helix (wHTH) protein/tetratricopeptide (TPR) repeat protein